MTLTLTVLRCPPDVAPEVRTVTGGEFSLGRGPDNDWVLPDPEKHLSKRHCVIAYRQGTWQVAGTSTNGTFINRDTSPLESRTPHVLEDGDRLILGVYEIEIRLAEEAQQSWGRPVPAPAAKPGPFGNPFDDDPFAPAPLPSNAITSNSFATPPTGPGSGLTPFSATLPAEFDPLAPDDDLDFAAPTRSDHSPAVSDAMNLPPAHSVLPDDWDDFSDIAAPAAAPPPPSPASAPAVRSAVAQTLPQDASFLDPPALVPAAPAAQPPSPVFAQPPSPLTEPPFAEPLPARVAPAPVAAESPPSPPPAPQAAVAVAPQPVMAPAPQPGAAPAPQAAIGTAPQAAIGTAPQAATDLLAAFLRGAGVDNVTVADPVKTMENLGAAFRAVVAGIRHTLIARSEVKREFRIEATVIRQRGNNLLKFSANDDDALTGLLGTGRRTEMGPEEAITDALTDIRLHELATMTAMQSAVRALVERLGPDQVPGAKEQGGGLALLSNRKARAWDSYEALHAEVLRGLSDDFDSLFGKRFAQAYEKAMQELTARQRTEKDNRR